MGGVDFLARIAGNGFDYLGMNASLPALQPAVPGRHQFDNMATALAAAEALRDIGFNISSEAMREGVENFSWPGRLEWLADRHVLLDGAHNGAGARALASYLAEQEIENVHWIVGLKADKNMEEILAPILPRCAAVYCVEPPVEEAVPAGRLCSVANGSGARAVSFVAPEEAWAQARCAAGDDGIILVAGSLFLVAVLREMILREEGRPCGNSF
jgi:dihydrofolate synthase/folylpolyglutamate synthase